MKEIMIDCSHIGNREELHRVFAEALSFPEYYGSNLDALHDCLTSLSLSLHLVNWEQNALGTYARPLQRVLESAAAHNPQFTIFFE